MFKLVHVGIPTTQEKKGETYNEGGKIYTTDPTDSPLAIEYVRFLPGTAFPESIHYEVHIAAEVDDIEKYIEMADDILVPKMDNGDAYLCFVRIDGVIFELMQIK